MARRKKPEGETSDQAAQRKLFEDISNHATRGEKVSWHRLMDNMVSLLGKLRPIENKIIALEAEKRPIIDDVTALRVKMVKECVHPYEQLVEKDGLVECKFCNRKFGVLQSSLFNNIDSTNSNE